MKSKTVVIVGSSRSDGDTTKIVQFIKDHSNWRTIDLNDFEISYYDYSHANKDDDFLPLMREMLEQHETFVFLTPVYWFSMSGIMKVFFDRITDLLTIEKELGRKLRNKKMAALSCSIGKHLGETFWLPFKETAKYLGMEYLGNLHTIAREEDDYKLLDFIEQVETFSNSSND